VDEAFAAELRGVRWFASVGQPPAADLPFDPLPVSSWAEGVEHFADPPWDEIQLAARNELTGYLSQHQRERYRQWNEITRGAKVRLIGPLTESVWVPFASRYGLGPEFVSSVSWDVLAAVMAHEYRGCRGRPVFLLDLLRVFRAGHVPCGWYGEWPSGRVVVW
jgi:hypothetical protein